MLALYKLVPLEPSHGRGVGVGGGGAGGTQVLKLYKLSRCSAPSKGYPFWHCVPLVRYLNIKDAAAAILRLCTILDSLEKSIGSNQMIFVD